MKVDTSISFPLTELMSALMVYLIVFGTIWLIFIQGYFPCGRTKGAYSAYFDIPDQIDGDVCVLEWIWKAANFTIRQCADISVISAADSACYGQCQNGGICQNGACVCPPGYSGANCEIAGGE